MINITPKKILIGALLSLASCSLLANTNSSNPYQSSSLYVDPDYATKVNQFFGENPEYKTKAQSLNLLNDNGDWNISTAIWLDRKAAIYDSTKAHGIYWHLKDAYNKSSESTVLTFVVYNLPARDCDAYSSNGEIKIALKNGEPDADAALMEYKKDYIDPIKQEFSRFYTDYPGALDKLKVVLVIEPDSLPNMITNQEHAENYPNSCQVVASKHVYERGIRYALKTFSDSSMPLFMYLDIAHSGWLGWKSNANNIYTVYNSQGVSEIDKFPYNESEGGLGSGFTKIRGFITNTSNYTPIEESFNPGFSAGENYEFYTTYNNHLMDNNFYQWNDSYDESTFIALLLSLDNSTQPHLHFDMSNDHRIIPPQGDTYFSNMHFIVDTSRNGWNAMSTNGFTQKDQRHHRGNWCNVENIMPSSSGKTTVLGAGLGFRPQANPQVANPIKGRSEILPIDAYVWIKPPGESDGNYDAATHSGDQMCSDLGGGNHNENNPTDSLQGDNGQPAPHAGDFFTKAFKKMLDNALN
jgi:cellulose 1,4-beta-cellobiosidase